MDKTGWHAAERGLGSKFPCGKAASFWPVTAFQLSSSEAAGICHF